MNDQQLLRYNRQIVLPQIDIDGQQALLASHVVIIGLGGLGSPVALYLAAAGVGQITLVDDDDVELSNLQRQIIHTEAAIGLPKVESAKQSVLAINSDIRVNTVTKRLDKAEMIDLISKVDVVVDCTDNFAARFLINEATQQTMVPLVSGAAIRFEGQVTVYDPRQQGSACYRCIYQGSDESVETCSTRGVLSPLLGVIGSIQAIETVKLLTHNGESLSGRLLLLDGLSMSWRELRIKADPHCPVCHSIEQ